jgi:hypothetical protein
MVRFTQGRLQMKRIKAISLMVILSFVAAPIAAETRPCSQVIQDLSYDSLNSADAALEQIGGNIDSTQGFGETVTTDKLHVAQWNACQMAMVIANRGGHQDLIVEVMAYSDDKFAGVVTSNTIPVLEKPVLR